MGKNSFEVGHFCERVQRVVTWQNLVGTPMKCPVCEGVIMIKPTGEREVRMPPINMERQAKGGPERG